MPTPAWLDRRFVLAQALLAALAIVLCFLPLFALLGYEFSAAIALVGSFLAAWLGTRAQGIVSAAGRALSLLVLPLLFISANALRVRNCDYATGLAFYALLPGLSVLCGAATGFVLRRTRRPVLFAVLTILFSLGWGLVRFYRTPAIFGFDPYLGYFPGTLYDEDLALPVTLFLARAMHLLAAAGAVLVSLRRPRAAALALGAAAVLFLLRGRIGLAPDADDIARGLGRSQTTAHFRLVYARGSATERDLELVKRDHEFRYAELSAALGVEPGGRITSFLFPTAAEKKRWMGAGRTFIAKPWRREVYLQEEGFPHPVLKHELAHVFAGAAGDPVFAVSMTFWPPRLNVGLIEGVAVALDWRGGRELDAAQAARGLEELGMAPPLRSILGVGFLGAPGPRAYTVAGAFCRYLLETYGAEKLRALYRSAGRFERVYGQPLGALERDLRAWLGRVPLGAEEREVLRESMRQPAVWHKVCAHTLALLRARADDAWGRSDFAEAERCLEQIARDDADEPQHLYDLAELRSQAGDRKAARATALGALGHPKTGTPLRAHLLDLLGDIAWKGDNRDEARARWTEAHALPTDEPTRRTLRAKLVLLEDPRLAAPLGRFFLGERAGRRDPALDLWLADRAIAAAPDRGLPVYLLGRGLSLREAFADALEPLDRSRALGLPDPAFEREALRLAGWAAYRAGDPARARRAMEELGARPDCPGGVRIEADDLISRIEWEQAAGLTKAAGSGTVPLPTPGSAPGSVPGGVPGRVPGRVR